MIKIESSIHSFSQLKVKWTLCGYNWVLAPCWHSHTKQICMGWTVHACSGRMLHKQEFIYWGLEPLSRVHYSCKTPCMVKLFYHHFHLSGRGHVASLCFPLPCQCFLLLYRLSQHCMLCIALLPLGEVWLVYVLLKSRNSKPEAPNMHTV